LRANFAQRQHFTCRRPLLRCFAMFCWRDSPAGRSVPGLQVADGCNRERVLISIFSKSGNRYGRDDRCLPSASYDVSWWRKKDRRCSTVLPSV